MKSHLYTASLGISLLLIGCGQFRTERTDPAGPILEVYAEEAAYMMESDITDVASYKDKKVNRSYQFSSGESYNFVTYNDDVIDADMIISSRSRLANAAMRYESELNRLGPQGAMADKCTSRFLGFLWCNGFYGRPWSNNTMIIEPYSSALSSNDRTIINSALNHITNRTNLRFVFSSSGDRVVITNNSSGCFSNLGRVGGQQRLNLGPGCMTMGIVVHELLHAAGMIHEHQRHDRDTFITINTNNLTQLGLDNIASMHDASDLTEYSSFDYGSIMMYPRTTSNTAFVKDTSQPMFTLKQSYSGTVGQRTGLSSLDIATINARYR